PLGQNCSQQNTINTPSGSSEEDLEFLLCPPLLFSASHSFSYKTPRAESMATRFDDVVIKPPTDRRSYRIVHLPNGLCAVLVHDPEIYPDGIDPTREGVESPMEEAGAMEDDEDEDEDGDEEDDEYESEGDDEELEDGDEEEGEEEEEEREEDGDGSQLVKKNKKGASPTKKVTDSKRS
ncbi:hypothetical protein GW17_00026038, partial [Ensete ventricosum]